MNTLATPIVPLEASGPAELPTRLPGAALLHALRGAGERPTTSLDAGTFICNEVFYGLCDSVKEQKFNAI